MTFAEDGAEALAHIEAGETFDVVITDIDMPGMTGFILFARLVKRDPMYVGRILVMSGGPKDRALAAWVDALPAEWRLRKPFDLNAVSDAIRRVLAHG